MVLGVVAPLLSAKRRLASAAVTSLGAGDVVGFPLRPWVAGIVEQITLKADLVVVSLHGGGSVTYPYGSRVRPLAINPDKAPTERRLVVRRALYRRDSSDPG